MMAGESREIDLIESLQKERIDLGLIETSLTNLYRSEDGVQKVKDCLTMKDAATGDTALHLACKKANYNIVKLLLNFDADTHCLNNDRKKPSQCLPKGSEKIAALLRLYQRWNKDAEMFGSEINRTLFLIAQATQSVLQQEFYNKSGVLFLGKTRKGKSVFVNNLLNVNYVEKELEDEGRTILEKLENVKEPATVGRTDNSETFHPTVYDPEHFGIKTDYTLIDMAGLDDTRADSRAGKLSPYDVSSAISLELLAKQLKTVRAIVLVIAWNDLISDSSNDYISTFIEAANILANNPTLKDNFILAITKPNMSRKMPEETTVANNLEKKIKALPKNDYKEKLEKLIKLFIEHPHDKIIIADVRNETARKKFYTRCSDIKDSFERIRFADTSLHISRFNSLLQHIQMGVSQLQIDVDKMEAFECRQLLNEVASKDPEIIDTDDEILRLQNEVIMESHAIDEILAAHLPTIPVEDIEDKRLELAISDGLLENFNRVESILNSEIPCNEAASAGAGVGAYVLNPSGLRAETVFTAASPK